MILELVDESRLLIILSPEDMEDYQLTFDSLDWQNGHSRSVIKEFLRMACRQKGFCPGDSRLLIEAVPDEEGCVLLVTMLPEEKAKRKVYRIKENQPSLTPFSIRPGREPAGSGRPGLPPILPSAKGGVQQQALPFKPRLLSDYVRRQKAPLPGGDSADGIRLLCGQGPAGRGPGFGARKAAGRRRRRHHRRSSACPVLSSGERLSGPPDWSGRPGSRPLSLCR